MLIPIMLVLHLNFENNLTQFQNEISPMKKIYFLIILVFPSFLSFAQSHDTYPTFVLNDTFSHAQPKGSSIVPQKYQLTSLKGFKLNCSTYDFSLIRSLNEGKDPTAIFILSKGGSYMVPLVMYGETVVDASTMKCLDYPKKNFTLFENGDTPIIAIGDLVESEGASSMRSYWISMIDVKN